ncbi:hypothetical protein DRE_04324 [Drechslerella stenobrocha 248]|uniref:Cytochrome P450 n=1 Tax=Drechslerella stenobrocha 248 TaxID=1043628 RepID=W7HQE4_9PEZI|nr:hypothetical protein DRE_04324 [Drechslerella stenobrocha 248]
MEILTQATEWLNRDASLALSGAVIALTLCTIVLYKSLTPQRDSSEPPLIPYTIPWLGSGISFSRDFDNFMQWVRRVMPADTPYTLYAGGRTIYLITSPRLYAKMIRISKTVSFDLLELDIFKRVFEMPREDLDAYSVGMHGMPPPTGMSQEQADELALAPQFARQYKDNWSNQSEGLSELTQRFSEEWWKRLDTLVSTSEATISFRKVMEHHFFWSATTVHFGTHFQDIVPDAGELFWEFEEGFLKLFQDVPKWMLRPALRAREKLIDGVERWLVQASKHVPAMPEDKLWDEWWGGRVGWERTRALSARGLSPRANAVHQFGFLWGLNGNTLAVVSWTLINILRDPQLLAKLQKEVETAISVTPKLTIDWPALMKLPLLTSVYQESIRLAVSNMTTRVITADTELDGYILKKGRMMVAPSRSLHLSPVFEHPSHPATEFWAERFIAEDADKPKMLNSWKPFAGGTTYCPGRFIAAAEIYSAIGILIVMFDVKLEESQGEIQHSPGRSGTGGVRPDRDGLLVLKRR